MSGSPRCADLGTCLVTKFVMQLIYIYIYIYNYIYMHSSLYHHTINAHKKPDDTHLIAISRLLCTYTYSLQRKKPGAIEIEHVLVGPQEHVLYID